MITKLIPEILMLLAFHLFLLSPSPFYFSFPSSAMGQWLINALPPSRVFGMALSALGVLRSRF